jgi:hypothetical protein
VSGTRGALGPVRTRNAAGGHNPKGSLAEGAHEHGESPFLGPTTIGGAATSKVLAGDRSLAPEAGSEVEATVTRETTIPTVTHETAARDSVVSSGPLIGTSSSRPQKAAASGVKNADGDLMGEPEIILGHPALTAPGTFP